MNAKQFITLSSSIFLVLALLHILRIFCGWHIIIGSVLISTGPSWLAAGFLTVLSVIGFYLSRKEENHDDPGRG